MAGVTRMVQIAFAAPGTDGGRAPARRRALRHARPREPDCEGSPLQDQHRDRCARGGGLDLLLRRPVFARGSRYERVPEDVYVDARGREIPYKLLRILPPALPAVQSHVVVEADRLDLLAHGVPRRSRVLLADLRREHGTSPRGAHRRARPPARHPAGGAVVAGSHAHGADRVRARRRRRSSTRSRRSWSRCRSRRRASSA